ncbi:exodeoxyribonuclease VII large subunit [Candidatus Saccharibacteria bacterium]|nr:exodeoxyribonuclease VII large subunit [Candidatus Saccharibacteria bacterium]
MSSFTPSDFIAVLNQTLEYAYSSVLIEGEVASYKVSQGKWVFFDLKDDIASIPCYIPVWNLRVPIEDGMKIVVRGIPNVRENGRFSFTVNAVKPVGDGNLKKAFEALKKKLTAEGLFDVDKKRPMPRDLTKLGVISSTGAAGYADFIKIINARWGGMKVQVAHTQVQGMDAPDQIIRALEYFNERSEVQAIAILRGGGSADDLACFNDEKLVRAIAASKIPIITGIGHEVDESLADLAADKKASTPSNAAELLTCDKVEEWAKIEKLMAQAKHVISQKIEQAELINRETIVKASNGIISKYIEPILSLNREKIEKCWKKINDEISSFDNSLKQKMRLLEVLNPEKVLSQGYAILSGKISPGSVVKITTFKQEIEAVINKVKER